MPAIDRAALAAEDAVTDRYKEAPWRFGVEHESSLNPVEHGAWTVEQGHRVWRLALAAEGATSMSLRFDTYTRPQRRTTVSFTRQTAATCWARWTTAT